MRKNLRNVWLGMIVLAFVFTAFGIQHATDHKILFEKARYVMETKGDLMGAIDLFGEIIQKYPDEREYAARSQLYIGICYEKLGFEQAQMAFQKVVENYPEQVETVEEANKMLFILKKAQNLAEANDDEFRIRKVFSFGANGKPSWDGRLLSCRDGSGDIAIIDIATKKKKRLTNSASWEKGDFVSCSIISPNAKLITYGWCHEYSAYDLKIININGSEQRSLHAGRIGPEDEAEFIWPYDWTPDSQYVVGTFNNGYHAGSLNKGRENKIVFVSVADGSLKSIKSFNDIGPEALDLSPDGRWLAYEYREGKDPGQYDVFLMRANGDNATALAKNSANDRLLGWTPSGDSILFASDRAGSWDAWIVPVKDGKASGEPKLVKRDFGQIGGPIGITPLGFTENGSFYYEVHSWMEEVHVAVLDQEKAKLLGPPKKVAERFQGTNSYADWSPDGKYLAFSSRRSQNSSALCLFSIDEEMQRDIFPELETFIRVNWFPDGKSVTVVGGDKQGRGGIYRVNIETSTASPIVTEGSGFHSPRCSPDGKYIFYGEDTSWEDKVFRIMKVDAKSGQKTEIHRSSEQIIRLDISPDGELLAFLDPADNALKIMPSDGGQPKVVFKFEEGWSTSVAWSPDGEYLFFSKVHEGDGKGGRIELWRIPSGGGKSLKFPLIAKGMENIRIHPDGRKIAFNTFEVKNEIWVMENFLTKVKK